MHTQSSFRLLVVRLGAMGDVLHALPAVTALRRAHPSWTIDWVIEPAWQPLLTATNSAPAEPLSPAQPLVNRIHLAPAKAWARRPLSGNTLRQIAGLRRILKASAYSAVLDFQGAVRSALIARATGSARVIGEANPRESAAKWFFSERIGTVGRHVIEQDIELAAAVAGDTLPFVPPLLPVDPEAESWCDRLLAPFPRRPLALLKPGAGWGAKRWPVERYAAVASALAERGFCVLVNAGPGEEPLAESVAAQSGGAATAVLCSLAQLIALTQRTALAIGGDTGPIHLACALGRPVVGIYGPTDPARNGPYGTRFRVLRSPFSLRNHARRNAPEAGLLTITPEDVLKAVDEVIAEEGGAMSQEAAR
ncbi:MAG TPA: glycosyltransferase family 9 protein [Terracidiphilus sp.]|nr:glycosyltransferase family 9 protein [Terracidiphilus sp.]